MNTKSKNGLLIFGSVVALGAVALYLYKRAKMKKNLQGGGTDGSTAKEPSSQPESSPQGQQQPKPSEKKTPATATGLSSLSKSQVQAFQDWMDQNHPNWVNGKNLNRGAGYGTKGPATTKAFAKYGAEWRNSKSVFKPNVNASGYENAIAFLVSKGFKEAGLRGLDPNFIAAWAPAMMTGKQRFLYKGTYYDTARGLKSSNQNADAFNYPI